LVRTYLPQKFVSGKTVNYPPQGFESGDITPPVGNGWIDDLNNQFVDDLNNDVVFDV